MASSERKAIVLAKADDLLGELHIKEPSEIDIERIRSLRVQMSDTLRYMGWMVAWFAVGIQL